MSCIKQEFALKTSYLDTMSSKLKGLGNGPTLGFVSYLTRKVLVVFLRTKLQIEISSLNLTIYTSSYCSLWTSHMSNIPQFSFSA